MSAAYVAGICDNYRDIATLHGNLSTPTGLENNQRMTEIKGPDGSTALFDGLDILLLSKRGGACVGHYITSVRPSI